MTMKEALDVTADLDGGVMKTIIKDGEGFQTPSDGCTVTVHYEGKLIDGTVFDSSRDRQPFEFELGRGIKSLAPNFLRRSQYLQFSFWFKGLSSKHGISA